MKKQLTPLEEKLLKALLELKHWVGKLSDWEGADPPTEVVDAAINEATADIEIPLEKVWTDSSQVNRTKYIPESSTLEVEFKSNSKVYHYFGVTPEVWEKCVTCASIGSFINKEIKGKFEYQLQGETTNTTSNSASEL